MTIEFARNVLGLEMLILQNLIYNKNPVISLMEEQKNIVEKGGTMRLGAWKCQLKPNTKLLEIYGNKNITERHRHRYEFNSDF
jgi:CTP synthase